MLPSNALAKQLKRSAGGNTVFGMGKATEAARLDPFYAVTAEIVRCFPLLYFRYLLYRYFLMPLRRIRRFDHISFKRKLEMNVLYFKPAFLRRFVRESVMTNSCTRESSRPNDPYGFPTGKTLQRGTVFHLPKRQIQGCFIWFCSLVHVHRRR